jgi:hypothetical protein
MRSLGKNRSPAKHIPRDEAKEQNLASFLRDEEVSGLPFSYQEKLLGGIILLNDYFARRYAACFGSRENPATLTRTQPF